MKRRIILLLVTVLLLVTTSSAAAQEYSFNLNQEIVHVFWNSDGTLSLDYYFVFTNDPGAHVIDFVDVGMPNSDYDFSSITADVDGKSLNISSDFQGDGPYGFSVDMGAYAIQPGEAGHVHIAVGRITHMLYNDTNEPKTYASGEFSPAYWTTAHGATDLTVVFHLPPDMPPGEPRYHNPAGGWPGNDAPQAAYDNQNRVTYTWNSASANGYAQYTFGMSFPKQYVPASAIVQPSIWEQLGISADTLISFGFFACCGLFFVGVPLLIVGGVILLIVLAARKIRQETIQNVTLKVDLPGETKIEAMKCRSCGGELSADNIKLVNGAPMVTCPYCNTVYQLTEEPKW